MKTFLKPSWPSALPAIILVVFAILPEWEWVLLLRYTLYTILALPLMPIIQALGLVYSDKPWYLTPSATFATAVFWGSILYLMICWIRRKKYEKQ